MLYKIHKATEEVKPRLAIDVEVLNVRTLCPTLFMKSLMTVIEIETLIVTQEVQ